MSNLKILKVILSEIEKAPISAGCSELAEIMKKSEILMPTAGMDSIKDKCINSLHTAIQTEMMIKSCVYAKCSCFCAAIAALMAFISTFMVFVANK
jgi:hypothetical protein